MIYDSLDACTIHKHFNLEIVFILHYILGKYIYFLIWFGNFWKINDYSWLLFVQLFVETLLKCLTLCLCFVFRTWWHIWAGRERFILVTESVSFPESSWHVDNCCKLSLDKALGFHTVFSLCVSHSLVCLFVFCFCFGCQSK